MTERHLHIVSFNIPYPPDYGGVIDVYYKIKSLFNAGVKVHLHCFQYGREETEVLHQICESVNYYPRKKFYQAVYSKVPYIVASRQSGELLSRLIEDDYPIIFEGLHTCYYLSHPSLKDRIKAVRMHNLEWDYYRSLGKVERNFFKKFYFFSESKKLKSFEHELSQATTIFAISPNDLDNLKTQFEHTIYLPAFHQNEAIKCKEGKGKYALYHGNLSVVENNQGALYLLTKVFERLDITLFIAGKNPLSTLKKEIAKHMNAELIENPTDAQMMDLIQNAHVNVLTTFQSTGIKLKLLNALYNGRFCLTNSRMVQNTGLEELCIVENDSKILQRKIDELFDREFSAEEIEHRSKVLNEKFSNEVSAEIIIKSLFPQTHV